MLKIAIEVVEVEGRPNDRQYVMPEGMLVLQGNLSADSARAEFFEDLEQGNPVPGLLAHKLFAIPSVQKVVMEQDSFTIVLAPNHGNVDERVLQAIRSVIASTVVVEAAEKVSA